MTCPEDKDFMHELPRREAEAIRRKKRSRQKNTATTARQNAPKVKSSKSMSINSKKRKGR